MGALAGVLGLEQALAVVGELHSGAGDFDAGASAGGLLIFGLFQDGFGELDIGLDCFEIGIRANGSHAAVGVTGGCELRWERRAHAAGGGFGGAVARGGAVFEGTADLRFGRRFRPFLLATYSGSAHYLFGRAAFRFQCSNLDWSGPVTWSAGLEATGQGNADTDALQAGALLESALTRARLSIGLHGGYKWSDTGTGSRRVCGYGGLSLYRRF